MATYVLNEIFPMYSTALALLVQDWMWYSPLSTD